MQDKDIKILAAAIKKHRDANMICELFTGDKVTPITKGIEAVAYTFARFPSVDKKNFLELCGIE